MTESFGFLSRNDVGSQKGVELTRVGGTYTKPPTPTDADQLLFHIDSSNNPYLEKSDASLISIITATHALFTSAVTITGSADAVQLSVVGNATQTNVLQNWRNSTPTTVASISNLGHAAFGQATAPAATVVVGTTKSFADPGAATVSYDADLTTTYTGSNANVVNGLRSSIHVNQSGGNNTSGANAAVRGLGQVTGSANTVTGIVGGNFQVQNTGAGTVTTGYAVFAGSVGNSGGGTFSTAYGVHIADQTAASVNYALYTNAGVSSVLGSATIASAAGAVWKGFEFRAATATISGSTHITTATGFNYIHIAQPTLSAGSALTVDNAATVYIANAPAASGAGPAAITNAYALWVDAGATRLDGNIDVSNTSIDVLVNSAGLNFRQATVGNAVQSIISTATNDDPTEIVYQNRVTTTDGTQTTLHTFTVPASTTYVIVAIVSARRTGGSAGTAEDGAGYMIMGTYKNVTGTATIIGAVAALATMESQAGFDATFDVTGATVRCRVTGATNNNLTWHMTARVYPVGT